MGSESDDGVTREVAAAQARMLREVSLASGKKCKTLHEVRKAIVERADCPRVHANKCTKAVSSLNTVHAFTRHNAADMCLERRRS